MRSKWTMLMAMGAVALGSLGTTGPAGGEERPGVSTKQIEIRNLGRAEAALGRSGIALRFTIELNREEAGRDERRGAMQGTSDLVLDPQGGRVLEVRS